MDQVFEVNTVPKEYESQVLLLAVRNSADGASTKELLADSAEITLEKIAYAEYSRLYQQAFKVCLRKKDQTQEINRLYIQNRDPSKLFAILDLPRMAKILAGKSKLKKGAPFSFQILRQPTGEELEPIQAEVKKFIFHLAETEDYLVLDFNRQTPTNH